MRYGCVELVAEGDWWRSERQWRNGDR